MKSFIAASTIRKLFVSVFFIYIILVTSMAEFAVKNLPGSIIILHSISPSFSDNNLPYFFISNGFSFG
jgi:hypothetical protein